MLVRSGDMRVRMGYEIVTMWDSLGEFACTFTLFVFMKLTSYRVCVYVLD